MDDHDLRELFRDAPGEAPPPGFGVADVTAASQRATARHRLRVATASSAAVLVLAGGGLFAALGPLSGGETTGNSGTVENDVAAAAPQMDSRGEKQPSPAEERLSDGGSEEQESAKQGVETNESSGGATRTERCTAVDRRLATALAGELPVDPPSEPVCAGADQAAYRVQDGSRSGVITVAIAPKGDSSDLATGSDEQAVAETNDGRTIVVSSRGEDGGPSPYASQLQEIAEGVADGL